MPEIGRIKIYISAKECGFIQLLNGEDIYFNLKHERLVENGGNQPVFSSRYYERKFSLPQAGDLVVFERRYYRNPRFPEKAYPWAYLTDWEEVEQEIIDQLSSLDKLTDPNA